MKTYIQPRQLLVRPEMAPARPIFISLITDTGYATIEPPLATCVAAKE